MYCRRSLIVLYNSPMVKYILSVYLVLIAFHLVPKEPSNHHNTGVHRRLAPNQANVYVATMVKMVVAVHRLLEDMVLLRKSYCVDGDLENGHSFCNTLYQFGLDFDHLPIHLPYCCHLHVTYCGLVNDLRYTTVTQSIFI